MNWVIVRSFGNRVEAELAVAMLESCGIKAMVNGDDQGYQNAFLAHAFGVNVLALEEHRAEAEAILAAAETAAVKTSQPDSQVKAPQPQSRRVRILRLLCQISWFLFVVICIVELWLEQTGQVEGWIGPFMVLMVSFACCFVTFEYLRQNGKERSRQRLAAMDADGAPDLRDKI